MWWTIGMAANFVVAGAYLAIAAAIIVPLVTSGQVGKNRLGVATAAIFFTCAVHHGGHAVHLLLPSVGLHQEHGGALRQAFDWHQAGWDVLSAVVGLYYWSLRNTYGPLMRGAALFQDLKEKQRQALEINDNVVQGLVVAKMALELGERERSKEAVTSALASAQQIISDLIGEAGTDSRLGPGDLVRRRPARLQGS